MCSPACVAFATSQLRPEEIAGKRVIEVGSLNVNGSLRSWIESFGPAAYVGVDITDGPGVDEICDAGQLVERFGRESFDLVVSTEMLEHVRDWRGVVSNLKNLLAPGGTLLVTTRSAGFGYHGFPYDFWRFGVDDFATIFADTTVQSLAADPDDPGVFLKATRPDRFSECTLDGISLYSILKSKRCPDIGDVDAWVWSRYWRMRPSLVRLIPTAFHEPLRGFVRRRREQHQ
jgi:SAM-dependent methyltransferase